MAAGVSASSLVRRYQGSRSFPRRETTSQRGPGQAGCRTGIESTPRRLRCRVSLTSMHSGRALPRRSRRTSRLGQRTTKRTSLRASASSQGASAKPRSKTWSTAFPQSVAHVSRSERSTSRFCLARAPRSVHQRSAARTGGLPTPTRRSRSQLSPSCPGVSHAPSSQIAIGSRWRQIQSKSFRCARRHR